METIKKYLRRYFIDAMGAMALGLFASLLIGTIFKAIGMIPTLEFMATVGGYAQAMAGPAMAAAIAFCVILGVTIEKLAYKPLRGAAPLAVLITAIGMSYLLQSLAQIVFGSSPKILSKLQIFGGVKVGALVIDYSTILTLGVTVIIMVSLSLFVKMSKTGRAMVAVSEDRDAALLMGINTNAIITITFAIGSALAAIAGYLMLCKAPGLSNTLGAMPGIKAFTAAVIGGIGSIPGAMLGGILLGIVESISYSIPALAPYTEAVEFSILIVVLLVKPSGILGKMRREKV